MRAHKHTDCIVCMRVPSSATLNLDRQKSAKQLLLLPSQPARQPTNQPLPVHFFSLPSSRIDLVYQSFCSRTIADRLYSDWFEEKLDGLDTYIHYTILL